MYKNILFRATVELAESLVNFFVPIYIYVIIFLWPQFDKMDTDYDNCNMMELRVTQNIKTFAI